MGFLATVFERAGGPTGEWLAVLLEPAMLRASLVGLAGLLLVASLACWLVALRRLQSGERLIPWTERRPVPWGLLDIMTCFVLLVIFDGAALQMAGLDIQSKLLDLSPAQQARALTAMTIGRITVAILGLLVLVVRSQARVHDTGVGVSRFGSDVGLGAVAFLMVAPPIYLLQTGLSQLFPETHHPLVDVVRENPSLAMFGAAFATAVVAAPLAEEFLLRGLLQGWLEKIAVWSGSSTAIFLGGSTEWEPSESWGTSKKANTMQNNPPAWPIFVSALLFASMHIQEDRVSPDPIPLFFFALVLGFLYQRTHRLLPCIVMHMLLNASSMMVLGLSVWKPELLPFESP